MVWLPYMLLLGGRLSRPEDPRDLEELVEGLGLGHDVLEVQPSGLGGQGTSPAPRLVRPGPVPENAKTFRAEDNMFWRLVAVAMGTLHLTAILVVCEPSVVGREVSMASSDSQETVEGSTGEDIQLLRACRLVVKLPSSVARRKIPGNLLPLGLAEVF